ncbi:MAG: DsrE family protein, partial [Deferribacterota bacterium]|nr:DsrE family protein [Deferribacterota bacterium]
KKKLIVILLLTLFFQPFLYSKEEASNTKKVLIILNDYPYDGSDKSWNALRLAEKLNSEKHTVRIFLINDSIDLAKDATKKPEGSPYDLVKMLKELIKDGVKVKACATCMNRCGKHKNEPYFTKNIKGHMVDLSNWIITSDKVVNF